MTSENSQENIFPGMEEWMSSQPDSPAKPLVLPAKEKVSKIAHEVLSFLKSLGWLKVLDHDMLSWRTLKDFFRTTKEGRSESSSMRWMNWGILQNGSCLTAKISEYPKTGKGCSLSDILEQEVSDRYFLSDQQVESLTSGQQRSNILDTQEGITGE